MINDIFATSMSGTYEIRRDGEPFENGQWSYRGYGNAEITMTADAARDNGGISYHLRIHSVERQLDEYLLRAKLTDGDEEEILATIAGHMVSLSGKSRGGEDLHGSLTVPDETVYGGPSPIWIIHQMFTALPPEDREGIAPIIAYNIEDGGFNGYFARISRAEKMVSFDVIDDDDQPTGEVIRVTLAEDGCPTMIEDGTFTTEIWRLPAPPAL